MRLLLERPGFFGIHLTLWENFCLKHLKKLLSSLFCLIRFLFGWHTNSYYSFKRRDFLFALLDSKYCLVLKATYAFFSNSTTHTITSNKKRFIYTNLQFIIYKSTRIKPVQVLREDHGFKNMLKVWFFTKIYPNEKKFWEIFWLQECNLWLRKNNGGQ